MGPWVVAYAFFFLGLFIFCAAVSGLKTALWGFGLTLFCCSLAFTILWWRDERRWAMKRAQEIAAKTPANTRLAALRGLRS
jgi:hypothetical protein